MYKIIHHLDWRGTTALIATILAWGAIPIFLRSFIHDVDGWTANGIRYGASWLVWTGPFLYWWRRSEIRRSHIRAALPAIGFNIMAQTLWAWSPYFLEAGMMSFMVRITVIFSISISFILFPRERRLLRAPGFWIGLSIAIFGFVGLTFLGKEIPRGATLTGLGIIVCCGLCYASYAIAVRYWIPDLPAHHAFSLICTFTAPPLMLMMLCWGKPSDISGMSVMRITLLALSGLLGIAFAHVTYYIALARLGVAIASSCNMSAPLLTVSGAYLILGETLTLGQIGSGLVLLLGTAFLVAAQIHVVGFSEPVEDEVAVEIGVKEPVNT